MRTILTQHPRRQSRSGNTPVKFINVSRLARDYAIPTGVQIDSHVIQQYDGYSSGSAMSTQECIISVLSYALNCEPGSESISVILTRCADGRPVEVVLDLQRSHDTRCACLLLVFAEEIEL